MNAHPDLSRRAFFTALPAVTAGLAIPAHAADEANPHWAMLVDTRRCIACQACTMACSMENVSPEGQFRTVVATYAVTDQTGKTGLSVLPRLCNHCEEPPCIPVCPVGATFKRKDGIVLVDGERCVGCAYCVQACPYDARFVNHHTGKADKCTFCSHRVFGDINNPQSEISRRLVVAEGKTSVLKPEAGTTPRVFYIGLDQQLDGRVDGAATADMMWRPDTQGA